MGNVKWGAIGVIFLLLFSGKNFTNASEDVVEGGLTIQNGNIWVNPMPELSLYVRNISSPVKLAVIRQISTNKFPNADLGSPAYIYTIFTDTQINDVITICIRYDAVRFAVPAGEVKFAQIDGGVLVLRTSAYNLVQVCGNTDHLSSFAAVQDFGMSSRVFSRSASGQEIFPRSTALSNGSVAYRFWSAPGDGEFTIVNGEEPVTGARIFLNGSMIANGSYFQIHQPIKIGGVRMLPGENVLEVFIDGPPDGNFQLSISRGAKN